MAAGAALRGTAQSFEEKRVARAAIPTRYSACVFGRTSRRTRYQIGSISQGEIVSEVGEVVKQLQRIVVKFKLWKARHQSPPQHNAVFQAGRLTTHINS